MIELGDKNITVPHVSKTAKAWLLSLQGHDELASSILHLRLAGPSWIHTMSLTNQNTLKVSKHAAEDRS